MTIVKITKKQTKINEAVENRRLKRKLEKTSTNAVTDDMIDELSIKSNISRIIGILPRPIRFYNPPMSSSDNINKYRKWDEMPYPTNKENTPWIPSSIYNKSNSTLTLTEELSHFLDYVTLGEAERVVRERVLLDISDAVLSKWPSAIVHIFGSFPAGLSTFLSDLDISVLGVGLEEEYDDSRCSDDDREDNTAPSSPFRITSHPVHHTISSSILSSVRIVNNSTTTTTTTITTATGATTDPIASEVEGVDMCGVSWSLDRRPDTLDTTKSSSDPLQLQLQPSSSYAYNIKNNDDATATDNNTSAHIPINTNTTTSTSMSGSDSLSLSLSTRPTITAINVNVNADDNVIICEDRQSQSQSQLQLQVHSEYDRFIEFDDSEYDSTTSNSDNDDINDDDISDRDNDERRFGGRRNGTGVTGVKMNRKRARLEEQIDLHLTDEVEHELQRQPDIVANNVNGDSVSVSDSAPSRPPSMSASVLSTSKRKVVKVLFTDRDRRERAMLLDKLKILFDYFKGMGWATETAELRAKARIPIISLQHRSGVCCDISMGVQSKDTTAQVEIFASIAPAAFMPLAAFLKVFLWRHGLDKPFIGGIGSFKLYAMIAAVLILHKQKKYQQQQQQQQLQQQHSTIVLRHQQSSSSLKRHDDNDNDNDVNDLGVLLVAFFRHFSQPSVLDITKTLCVAGVEVDFSSVHLAHACRTCFHKAAVTLGQSQSQSQSQGESKMKTTTKRGSAGGQSSSSVSHLARIFPSALLVKTRERSEQYAQSALSEYEPNTDETIHSSHGCSNIGTGLDVATLGVNRIGWRGERGRVGEGVLAAVLRVLRPVKSVCMSDLNRVDPSLAARLRSFPNVRIALSQLRSAQQGQGQGQGGPSGQISQGPGSGQGSGKRSTSTSIVFKTNTTGSGSRGRGPQFLSHGVVGGAFINVDDDDHGHDSVNTKKKNKNKTSGKKLSSVSREVVVAEEEKYQEQEYEYVDREEDEQEGEDFNDNDNGYDNDIESKQRSKRKKRVRVMEGEGESDGGRDRRDRDR
eukprot:gene10695-22330_t